MNTVGSRIVSPLQKTTWTWFDLREKDYATFIKSPPPLRQKNIPELILKPVQLPRGQISWELEVKRCRMLRTSTTLISADEFCCLGWGDHGLNPPAFPSKGRPPEWDSQVFNLISGESWESFSVLAELLLPQLDFEKSNSPKKPSLENSLYCPKRNDIILKAIPLKTSSV